MTTPAHDRPDLADNHTVDQGQELALALVSANLLSKTPEIYGKSPDDDAERSFEALIDVALTDAPAAVVRELARFAGTAVTMLAFRAGMRPIEFIEGMTQELKVGMIYPAKVVSLKFTSVSIFISKQKQPSK